MQDHKPDQSFDAIANKFDKNIYGSTKGRLRHQLLCHYLHKHTPVQTRSMVVLDAGGGTGEMTRTLAEMGHHLTLNDISDETLQLAREKLTAWPAIRYLAGDLRELEHNQHYDLICCHAVLEWLQSPESMLKALADRLTRDGYLSLSFFNRDAHRFSNILYGNFDYVKNGMQQKNTVRLNPNNSLYPKDVLALLDELGLRVVHQAGIRCFHDYLKEADMRESRYDELLDMEIAFGSQSPYMWLGRYFHIIATKSAGDKE